MDDGKWLPPPNTVFNIKTGRLVCVHVCGGEGERGRQGERDREGEAGWGGEARKKMDY